MIIYVNNYDVGIEALPTPTITLLLLLLNIVYYHIAARGWIITGNAIIQLYTIHER